jgi:hypothetical protein
MKGNFPFLTFGISFDAEVGARLGQYGIFTSFEQHVPSLISANKDEWQRLVQTMITRLEKRNLKDGFISDMVRVVHPHFLREYFDTSQPIHSQYALHALEQRLC